MFMTLSFGLSITSGVLEHLE